MKEHLNNNQTLRIDFIDWEYNYQGFIEFYSIESTKHEYYCRYKESLFVKLDKDADSVLDSNELESQSWFLACTDRTIRHELRNFLGLRKHLTRTELGSQDIDLARFSRTDESATPSLAEIAERNKRIKSQLKAFMKMVKN